MKNEILNRLREEYDSAVENEKHDKDYGSPEISLSFDAGRINGILQCLEIINEMKE